MTERFKGKTAIITSGTSGIGEAAVKQFAKEEAKAMISDMSNREKDLSDQLN